MSLVAVRFKKRYEAYNPGEAAGFCPKRAKELVNRGVAEYEEKPEPQTYPIRRNQGAKVQKGRKRKKKGR